MKKCEIGGELTLRHGINLRDASWEVIQGEPSTRFMRVSCGETTAYVALNGAGKGYACSLGVQARSMAVVH